MLIFDTIFCFGECSVFDRRDDLRRPVFSHRGKFRRPDFYQRLAVKRPSLCGVILHAVTSKTVREDCSRRDSFVFIFVMVEVYLRNVPD